MRRTLARTRLRTLFWRSSVDEEVADELKQHVELLARRFEEEGMTRDAARVAALQRFGDRRVVEDVCRELAHDIEDRMARRELFQELRQDLAYALRGMRRSPLFASVALTTLAIGISASTAIFSVVHTVLLRALPYSEADRIVMIWNSYRQGGTLSHTAISPPEYADIRDQSRVFDEVAALSRQAVSLAGHCGDVPGCEPERVPAYVVTPNFFGLLGARPGLGRDFVADDGLTDATPVVLLGHSLWLRRFGGDSGVIGRPINVGGQLRTVIGVTSAAVRFPEAPLNFLREQGELWIPSSWQNAAAEGRGNQYLGVAARLRQRASFAQAGRDLDAISGRFRSAFPDRYDAVDLEWRLDAIPLREQMIGDARSVLAVVSVAVAMLLLIACANVTQLTLARGTTRRREVALRTALGARRGRLVRQLLTESMLLAVAGGVLGTLFSIATVRILISLDPGDLPQLAGARIDATVLLFAAGISALTGILVGLVPALRQSATRAHHAMSDGSRGGTADRPRRGLRSLLVVAEVAMAVIMLVGAGLVARSFVALQRVDSGVDPGQSLTFDMTLPRVRYDSAAKLIAFHRELQARLAAIPGVTAAAGVYPLPMSGNRWSGSFEVEGRAEAPGGAEPHAEYSVALPGYFRTMGIALLAGRDFADTDVRGTPLVAIVDERLAGKYWPGESAVGKRINPNYAAGTWATVIGVVRHVYNGGPRDEGEPQIYQTFLQRAQGPFSYVLRTSGNPLALTRAVRLEVAALDPDLPLSRVSTMAALESRALARDRFNTIVLGAFAVAALALAAIGLYGIMAYLVSSRTGEIGIRVALGGRPRDVVALVIREGMSMAITGLVIGVAAALLLTRAAGGLLYGVEPADPITYAGIAILLAVVALVASAVPARRAARVDPATALRA